jgi:hypothetical protein
VTTLAERIPLDEITAQAREVKFGRTLLTLIAAVLFGLGWLVAKAFGVLWLAAAWTFVAARQGWRAGRAVPAGPSVPR